MMQKNINTLVIKNKKTQWTQPVQRRTMLATTTTTKQNTVRTRRFQRGMMVWAPARRQGE